MEGFQHAGIGLLHKQVIHFRAEPIGIRQCCCDGSLSGVRLVQLHGDHIVIYHKGPDLLILKQLQHIGIGDLILALGKQAAGPGKHRDEQHQIHDHRDNSTILQWVSPYFVYTSGFRMPT